MSAISLINSIPSDWDRRFMQLAHFIGGWSKDNTRHVGCVIVGAANEVRATGYNGFPRGVDDSREERWMRPAKYFWTEHAERNAIYNAARVGTSLDGCRIYVPWFPCVDCARAMIQCGLVELVAFQPNWRDPQWGEHFMMARALFEDQERVIVRFLDPQFVLAGLAKSVSVPEGEDRYSGG